MKRAALTIIFLGSALAGCATTEPAKNYQSDIDSLNARVSTLQGEINAKDQQVQSLQNRLNDQDRALSQARQEQDALRQQLNAAQERLDAEKATKAKASTPAPKPAEDSYLK